MKNFLWGLWKMATVANYNQVAGYKNTATLFKFIQLVSGTSIQFANSHDLGPKFKPKL